jgi:hypothetical protein
MHKKNIKKSSILPQNFEAFMCMIEVSGKKKTRGVGVRYWQAGRHEGRQYPGNFSNWIPSWQHIRTFSTRTQG